MKYRIRGAPRPAPGGRTTYQVRDLMINLSDGGEQLNWLITAKEVKEEPIASEGVGAPEDEATEGDDVNRPSVVAKGRVSIMLLIAIATLGVSVAALSVAIAALAAV